MPRVGTYSGAVAQQPKKERLLLAILGGILVLFGFAISAFLIVVAVIIAIQGGTVDWVGIAVGVVITALIGLLGVWIVRRSGVPIGDAINF